MSYYNKNNYASRSRKEDYVNDFRNDDMSSNFRVIENYENIRKQIQLKKNSQNTYYSTVQNNNNVLTEYDNFPFNRFWKGVPTSEYSFVDGREAGWRVRDDSCYKGGCAYENIPKPNICFQYSYTQPPCADTNTGQPVISYR